MSKDQKPLGRKFDQDKPRWELLPYKEVGEIVEIFTFGAKKYSQKLELDSSSMLSSLEEELKEWNTALNAINIEWYIHEGCAEPATINSLKNRILNMPKDSEKTGENGNETIPISLLSIGNVDAQTQRREQRIEEQKEEASFEAEGSPKKQLNFYYKNKKIDAQYVNVSFLNAPCILIMTLKQDLQEATYVVAATTVLECLVTISLTLKKRLGIFSRLQQLNLSSETTATAEFTGDDNWKHVRPLRKRYFGALMRHMTAWYDGEKKDPESGKSHLAHAGCCLLFLMWGDHNVEEDE
jgi:hypothetical protein